MRMNNIWAIVLAAGASTRMKKQKLLLPFQRRTIVETVIHTISGVLKNNILVVLGSHLEAIERRIRKGPGTLCINERYAEGMLSSVICGFRGLPPEAGAAMVFLGDQPQIPSTVIRSVIDAWEKSGKGIVIPVFEGKRGHPVLIKTAYREEIEELDPEKGLRQLMVKFSNDVCEVECGKPEILRDIDTPRDYEFEINKTKTYGTESSV